MPEPTADVMRNRFRPGSPEGVRRRRPAGRSRRAVRYAARGRSAVQGAKAEGIVAGTPEEGGFRSAVHSVADRLVAGAAPVSAYAIIGAFWSKLLVGAGGENCTVSTRDPWEGIAFVSGILAVVLIGLGCVTMIVLECGATGCNCCCQAGCSSSRSSSSYSSPRARASSPAHDRNRDECASEARRASLD